MIRNKLGLPARSLMVTVAVAWWVPSGAAAVAVPVQNPPTAPSAPTNLTATALNSTTIYLTWVEPTSDGGSDITGYRIEMLYDGFAGWIPVVSNTGSKATSYTHITPPPSATLFYRVAAINAVDRSDYSDVATVMRTGVAGTPSVPLNLMAVAAGPTIIDLDWDAPASPGASAIIDYQVETSANGGGTWTLLTPTTQTSFQHTSLAAGVTPPLPGQGEERQRLRALDVPGERHHVNGNAARASPCPDGDGRWFLGDRAELEGAAEFRQQRGHRVSDRGVEHANRRMERSRGQHRQHAHHLPGHGPRAEHDPLLPRLGDQLLRHGSPLDHRRRHHPAERAGRAQAIDGRSPGVVGHRVGLDAAIVQRNVRRDRLPDPVVEFENRQMDGP